MTDTPILAQPLTIEELLEANQKLVEELADDGVRVELNNTIQEFLLIALVDKIIGPIGTPERDALDLQFQQHVSILLNNTVEQVAAQIAEQEAHAKRSELLMGVGVDPDILNRAQRRQQARQGN